MEWRLNIEKVKCQTNKTAVGGLDNNIAPAMPRAMLANLDSVVFISYSVVFIYLFHSFVHANALLGCLLLEQGLDILVPLERNGGVR